MIEKSIRTYTETGTSIDQGIEKSQKGIVVEKLKRALKTIIIPTTLSDPRTITFTPLDAVAARTLANDWHTDLILYRASNANVSKMLTKLVTAVGSNASGAADTLVLLNRTLYISRVAVTATQLASNSLVTGSAALFTKLTEYGTANERKYLVVTTRASAASGQLKFAWEVRGY